jgi:hypothetical protein
LLEPEKIVSPSVTTMAVVPMPEGVFGLPGNRSFF